MIAKVRRVATADSSDESEVVEDSTSSGNASVSEESRDASHREDVPAHGEDESGACDALAGAREGGHVQRVHGHRVVVLPVSLGRTGSAVAVHAEVSITAVPARR